jgi:hypothetical protein
MRVTEGAWGWDIRRDGIFFTFFLLRDRGSPVYMFL